MEPLVGNKYLLPAIDGDPSRPDELARAIAPLAKLSNDLLVAGSRSDGQSDYSSAVGQTKDCVDVAFLTQCQRYESRDLTTTDDTVEIINSVGDDSR